MLQEKRLLVFQLQLVKQNPKSSIVRSMKAEGNFNCSTTKEKTKKKKRKGSTRIAYIS